MKKIQYYLFIILSTSILFSQGVIAEVKLTNFSKGRVVDYKNGVFPAIKYSLKNMGSETIYKLSYSISFQDKNRAGTGRVIIDSMIEKPFSKGLKPNEVYTSFYSLQDYLEHQNIKEKLNEAKSLKGVIAVEGVRYELTFLKEEYGSYKLLKVIQ